MSEPLTFESLKDYDNGSLKVLFNQAMRQLFFDLDDRPHLKKKRRIVLELEFKPSAEGRDLAEVETTAKLKLSLPHKEARTNVLAPSKKHGSLMFDRDRSRTKSLPGQGDLDLQDSGDDD